MLSLFTDRARPPVQTYYGAAYRSLTPHLARRLKSLSQENNATLYMTLLATLRSCFIDTRAGRIYNVGPPTFYLSF